jgi:hypothetical protein
MVLEQPTSNVWLGEPKAPAPIAPLAANEAGKEIADFIYHAQNWAEDIAVVQNLGFEVDDDNEPAPKNIPTKMALIWILGGFSLKGRSGAGME